ncbi:MAG: hypothetical protein ACXWNJ_04350 [Vulcanimicrobiaceae bacterium]
MTDWRAVLHIDRADDRARELLRSNQFTEAFRISRSNAELAAYMEFDPLIGHAFWTFAASLQCLGWRADSARMRERAILAFARAGLSDDAKRAKAPNFSRPPFYGKRIASIAPGLLRSWLTAFAHVPASTQARLRRTRLQSRIRNADGSYECTFFWPSRTPEASYEANAGDATSPLLVVNANGYPVRISRISLHGHETIR